MELTHIAHIRFPRSLVSVGVALAMLGTPMVALAAPKGAITPESANDARLAVIGQAGNLPPGDAAPFLAEKGKELKDPVLYVESAEAYNATADAERSTAAAEEAKVQARVALDMVGFLEGDSTSEMWQPLEGDQTTVIENRAKQAIEDADVLIAAIEAEREAANAPPPPPPPPAKDKPPGRPLIIAGSASLVLGLGGIGVGAAGLVLGAENQKTVEDDPTIVGDEYDEFDRKGKNYNTMAIVGMAVGGVGLAAGAALIAIGVKKNKKAGLAEQRPTANVAPAFALGRGDAAGLVISGRF